MGYGAILGDGLKWEMASKHTASLLTHKRGMTVVSSARFEEIVDRCSNPHISGTAAARLNKLLRNPSLRSDLVHRMPSSTTFVTL